MSLAAFWVEDRGVSQALCFASDSRVTPGPVEGFTKTVMFSREDLAGVWVGDYSYATLILSHLDGFFTSHEKMRRRDVDLFQALNQAKESVRAHLRLAVDPRLHPLDINRAAQLPLNTVVVVGGYSIRRAEFWVLRVEYFPAEGKWRGATELVVPSRATFVGDHRERARWWAYEARKHVLPDQLLGAWRMEPLVAIQSAIETPDYETIGGQLQLVKTFKHGVSLPYGIRDPMTGDVWSRSVRLTGTAAREIAFFNRLVDTSAWNLSAGTYSRG